MLIRMMENSNDYKRYREQLDFIGILGMDDRSNSIVQDLNAVVKDIEDDVSYISTSKLLDTILYMYM